VHQGARDLFPFLDTTLGVHQHLEVVVQGLELRIPGRIYLRGSEAAPLRNSGPDSLVSQCLCTRSANGYLRQHALHRILHSSEPWVIPFIVLLAGEYVVEIIEDMTASLPSLHQESYANFVRQNRALMHTLRARATSYWNCYYRAAFPDKRTYPGLVFLHRLEEWAS